MFTKHSKSKFLELKSSFWDTFEEKLIIFVNSAQKICEKFVSISTNIFYFFSHKLLKFKIE